MTQRLDAFGLAVARRLPLAAALRLGAAEGRLTQRLGLRGPSTREIQAVFGLDEAEARRVARAQSANATRTRNLRSNVGLKVMRPMIEIIGQEHVDALAGLPIVFVVAPWGPLLAAVTGMGDLRPDILVLTNANRATAERWGIRRCAPGLDHLQAGVALKTAIDHLRGGGSVALTLAGRRGQRMVDVPFFGRTLSMPRGPAVMARKGAAAIVPVTATWRRGPRPLAISLAEPLSVESGADEAPVEAETKLLARLAATFENVARAAPSEADRSLISAAVDGVNRHERLVLEERMVDA